MVTRAAKRVNPLLVPVNYLLFFFLLVPTSHKVYTHSDTLRRLSKNECHTLLYDSIPSTDRHRVSGTSSPTCLYTFEENKIAEGHLSYVTFQGIV